MTAMKETLSLNCSWRMLFLENFFDIKSDLIFIFTQLEMAQSQQEIHWNDIWNFFRVINEDTIMFSLNDYDMFNVNYREVLDIN